MAGYKYPSVSISEAQTSEDGRQYRHLEVRFSYVDDRHISGLKEVLPNLVDLVASVRNEDLLQRARLLTRAYRPFDWVRPHVKVRAHTNYLHSGFLREVATGRAHEVALRMYADSADPTAALRKLRDEQGVLAVDIEGRDLYPSFQFESSTVKPIVVEVLRLLKSHDYGDWEIAIWFFCANGWLDGDSPIDVLLANDPHASELLRDAAEQEVAERY